MMKIDRLDDQQLWQQIIKDDQKAFDLLFKRYFHRLCKFLSNYQISHAEVEEVVADVFIKLWLNRHRYSITNIRAYLYASANNVAINQMKKLGYEWVALDEQFAELAAADQSADAQLELDDLQHQIAEYLKRLSPQQRNVFQLNRIEGFKVQEIAEILSISPKTVSNHLSESLKILSTHRKKVIDLLPVLIATLSSFIFK